MKDIKQRYPLFFLYLAVFINMVGFSMVFPLLPFYAQTFDATALQIGFLAASHALANFLASPILGRISDRFGRKPVLVVGLLLATFTMLVMGFANSLIMLLVGRILHGTIAGAIMPTTRAYMGDVTTKSQRIAAMGKIGAAFAAGQLIGPAASSFLVGLGDIQTPFFVAASVCLFNAICVSFFLPESLKQKEEKIVMKEGLLNFVQIFKHLKGEMSLLFIILFVWSFAMSNKQVAFPLLMEQKFNLGAEHIGYFFTVLAIVSIVVQGYLLPRIIKLWGEKKTIFIGLMTMGLGILFIPAMPTIGALIPVYMIMGFGSAVNRPTAEGLISKFSQVGQGTTMGIAHSFESLARVIGPLFGGILYAEHPTSPFVITAFFLFLLAIWSLRSLKIPTLENHKNLPV